MDFFIAAVASSGRWCAFQSLPVTQISSRETLAVAIPCPVLSSFATNVISIYGPKTTLLP